MTVEELEKRLAELERRLKALEQRASGFPPPKEPAIGRPLAESWVPRVMG